MTKTRSTMRRRAVKVEVRESAIHGWGVFALERIERGQRILEYIGARVSAHAEEDGPPAAGPVHTMLFDLGNGWMIDGADGGKESRFINHSCRPNCEAYGSRGRIFIHARRVIPAGDELLLDYGFDRGDLGEAEARTLYPCSCGAPRCRGTLTAAA
jgi:SET domain-containing protein